MTTEIADNLWKYANVKELDGGYGTTAFGVAMLSRGLKLSRLDAKHRAVVAEFLMEWAVAINPDPKNTTF